LHLTRRLHRRWIRRQRRRGKRPGPSPGRTSHQARFESAAKTNFESDVQSESDRPVRARQEDDVSQADIEKKGSRDQGQVPAGVSSKISRTRVSPNRTSSRSCAQLILEKAVAPQIQISDAASKLTFDKTSGYSTAGAGEGAAHLVADLPRERSAGPSSKPAAAGRARQTVLEPGQQGQAASSRLLRPRPDGPSSRTRPSAQDRSRSSGPVKSPFRLPHIQVEDKEPRSRRACEHARSDQAAITNSKRAAVSVFLQQLRSVAKIDVLRRRYKDLFPPVAAPRERRTGTRERAPAPATAAPSPAATK